MNIYVDLALPPEALAVLRAETAGHQLLFPRTPAASVLAQPEPDPQFAAADIAFGQPDPQAIAGAGALRWIHVSTSGITRYDNPPFRALMAQRKILVSNSAAVYCDACAVHVLAFMLAQARNLPRALPCRAANGTPLWLDLRGTSSTLRGETVLILGYGAIGRRLAQLLAPLGVNLIACRRQPRGDEGLPVITGDQLIPALGQAHHVINILPDSPPTRHFFDAARFAALRPGAIFYNIGRGSTVDQDALCAALHDGRVRAAWLDVTDPEPLPDNHPLWQAPHCFITPHIAGGHAHESRTLVQHFVANFQRFVQGKPLVDRIM